MPRAPFHYVDLRTFCYETEDQKWVEGAFRTFLLDEFDVDRVENIDHHGDRIIIFSACVERANDVWYVLDKMRDLPDFETLLDELDQRITDNTEFFLWLDKQAVFKGGAHRGEGLTLRVKVGAYPVKKEAAVENARDALLGDE